SFAILMLGLEFMIALNMLLRLTSCRAMRLDRRDSPPSSATVRLKRRTSASKVSFRAAKIRT
ncbi:hypothetical protein A2U01_0026753, partial [Trifolium medium]|nr:hypothetical protein [Trifolium medium]